MNDFPTGSNSKPLPRCNTEPVLMNVNAGVDPSYRKARRYSIQELQLCYDMGYPSLLEDVLIAFKGIKELPPDHPNSFFYIGGLHGEPFQLRESNKPYWGGWCNHGNVLFATWHRAYCRYIELALQTIVPDVGLPYFDETSHDTFNFGLPWILTAEKVRVKGQLIDNPLRSFVLPEDLPDNYGPDQHKYRKPKGYETVRFPFSGLVGTPEVAKATEEYNSQFSAIEGAELLNENFKQWLRTPGGINQSAKVQVKDGNGIMYQYFNCLKAPNYTVFSNTTSANQYNNEHVGHQYPLEAPHNDAHLAIGGYSAISSGAFKMANGDMGENNTAGLDPIFFLHHCFVDYTFWTWQRHNGHTESFGIEKGYQGTKTSDKGGQGPANGQEYDETLTMDSGLKPYLRDNEAHDFVTSRDMIDIAKLGYTFMPGSMDLYLGSQNPITTDTDATSSKKLRITNVRKDQFNGSFVIYAFVKIPSGEVKYVGHYTVLSRFDVITCANCQTYMNIDVIIPIPHDIAKEIFQDDATRLNTGVTFNIKIQRTDANGVKAIVEAQEDRHEFTIVA